MAADTPQTFKVMHDNVINQEGIELGRLQTCKWWKLSVQSHMWHVFKIIGPNHHHHHHHHSLLRQLTIDRK